MKPPNLCLALFLLASTGEASAGRHTAAPVQAGPTDAPVSKGLQTDAVSSLRARVDRRFAEFVEGFSANVENEEGSDNPLPEIREQWRSEAARCNTDSCRETVLRDQLRRLDFALGYSRRRIPGVPWSSGIFRAVSGEGVAGDISLFPLGDGRILARIVTFAPGDMRWICDLGAYGTVDADGTVRMRVLGSQARFLLHNLSADRIRLAPVNEGDDPLEICRVGPIFAEFRAGSRGD